MKTGDFRKIFIKQHLYVKKIIFAFGKIGINPYNLASLSFTNQNNFKYEQLYIYLADEGYDAFFSNHAGGG